MTNSITEDRDLRSITAVEARTLAAEVIDRTVGWPSNTAGIIPGVTAGIIPGVAGLHDFAAEWFRDALLSRRALDSMPEENLDAIQGWNQALRSAVMLIDVVEMLAGSDRSLKKLNRGLDNIIHPKPRRMFRRVLRDDNDRMIGFVDEIVNDDDE